jgi:Putative zinc-finger
MNEQPYPGRKNTCLEADQLLAWHDGALSQREATEVMAHLEGCARCAAEDRALLRDRRQVFELLSRLDPMADTHAEPAAALARFQKHLNAPKAESSFLRHSHGNSDQGTVPLSRSGRDDIPLTPVRHSTRMGRLGAFIQALAAVLVVGALVGTLLLLLASPHKELGGIAEKGCIFTSRAGFVNEYYLSAVTALAKNDIWVVGSFSVPARDPHALLEHWNGSQWCIRPDPYPITARGSVNLRAVAAASTNDVWAVGSVDDVPGRHTLIEHWNGSRWSVVPGPASGAGSSLASVTVISANDAWAVGDGLTEHWNGTRWSIVPSPHPELGSTLASVTAISANDVWAVGEFTNGTWVQTLTEHWNGSRWSIVPSPNPGTSRNELWGVTALSASDIWAVGGFSNSTQGQDVDKSLTLHWNGSQWSIVSSPSPNTIGNDLTSVTARSANDVWAVGTPYNILIEHWDGSRWSVIRRNATYGPTLATVALVPHSNTVVAVGVGSLLYFKDPAGESLSKP